MLRDAVSMMDTVEWRRMTGSTSAMSSTAVGAIELWEVATRLGSNNGREGEMAKLTVSATEPLVRPEMDRSDDGVEGDLRRRRFGRGRCGGLGRCERSGVSCHTLAIHSLECCIMFIPSPET